MNDTETQGGNNLPDGDASTSWATRIKKLVGYFAVPASTVYAVGWLLTFTNLKMLGVDQLDLTHEDVVKRGFFCVILSIICSFKAVAKIGIARVLLGGIALVYFGPWINRHIKSAGFKKFTSGWTFRLIMLGFILALSLLGLYFASVILSQRALLFAAPDHPDGAALFLALTNLPCALLTHIFERGENHVIYGICFLAVSLSVFAWYRLHSSYRAQLGSPARLKRWPRLAFYSVALFLVFQLISVPALYGFLLVSRTFPALELPAKEGPANVEDGTQKIVPSGEVLILGNRGGTIVVYELEKKQLWWVGPDALLPARRLPPVELFCPVEVD